MFGPRALRPLTRAARPALRTVPRSARSYASSAPNSAPKPDPHGADEHGKNLLLTTAAVALLVAAGSAVHSTREQHVAANPGSEAEEEQEAQQPEAVSEEAKPALESVVKQKLEEAKEAGAELLGLESADGAIASLIAEAEGALGFGGSGDDDEPSGQEALAAEAASQGAFNEETGEINWDCPCLGGMATGPCGEEFKAAFSCFVYSEAEPKGIDCVEKFKAMQDCFREHPDVYGEEEIEEDE